VVSKRGELSGRSLSATAGNGAALNVALPAESSVAAPVGDVIVYTRHSAATGSEVRALNLASGCDALIASPPEIVRSAVLGSDGTSLYVHSVARGARADAGVTRIDLSTGRVVPVLPGLRPTPDFGPIFGTSMQWSVAGSALAVQSCGFEWCLTRVLDTATARAATYEQPGQGAFIALTAEHLVTYADCPGLPCALLSTDLRSGAVAVLADSAGAVDVVPAGADGGAQLTIETSAGNVQVTQ
jgi:hypothetical protein